MNEALNPDWEATCKYLTEEINKQKEEFTHRMQLCLDQIADRDRIITNLQEENKIANAKLEMVNLIFNH